MRPQTSISKRVDMESATTMNAGVLCVSVQVTDRHLQKKTDTRLGVCLLGVVLRKDIPYLSKPAL